jgi:hypothetical protein
MTARLKRVVDTPMVAHLWANKSQDEARNARRNFYFDGDTIYSYGRHFPIARHVENKRGEHAVLMTTRTYSVTTAGHISCVRSACRHLTVFNVDHDYGKTNAGLFEDYRKKLLGLMHKYAKARSNRRYILTDINATVSEANDFAKFYGLRTRLKPPADLEAMVAECKRIEKAQSDKAKRAERERAAKEKEHLDAWVAGSVKYYASFYASPIKLRIFGDNLETSRGAVVPLKEAIRVYKILNRLRKRAKTYKRNGETIQLGQFALDSMDETGTVKVGCHTVEWTEIQRVAKLAGL